MALGQPRAAGAAARRASGELLAVAERTSASLEFAQTREMTMARQWLGPPAPPASWQSHSLPGEVP